MFRQTLCAAALMFSQSTFAEMVSVIGVGRSPITADSALTRSESLLAAKTNAVAQLINKINGPNSADDPAVQAKIGQIAQQVSDAKITDQSTSKDSANNLVSTITIQIDDMEIRNLISDMGIAQKTARNFNIMIVMDEFFTTPTNQQRPLRELVEYNNDQSAKYAENSRSQSSASSRSVDASSSASRVNARASSAAGYANRYEAAGAASRASYSGSASSGSYSADSARSSDSASTVINAEQKDVQSFRHLIEYQPQNVGPEKSNYTLQAVLRQTNKYDLAVKDADLFRNKYFQGKILTIDELNNTTVLDKFVQGARDDGSDYLMVGNSIILNTGKNAATGQFTCDGLLSLKTYSTEDASVIAAEARSESASGNTTDQCRVNLANKLGDYGIGVVGTAVLEYWKRRDTYGREYQVILRSLRGNLSEDAKDAFNEALEGLSGVSGKIVERRSTRSDMELSVTYKGDKPLSRALGTALRAQPMLVNAGRKTDGTKMIVCLEGQCP